MSPHKQVETPALSTEQRRYRHATPRDLPQLLVANVGSVAMEFSPSVHHIASTVCSLAFLGLCLYLMGRLLQLHQRQHRRYRYTVGLLIVSAALAIPPHIYATETQPYSLILAYTSAGVSWALLYWMFTAPLISKPTVLEVVTSYMQHSAYGACKGYAKYQRSLQHQPAASPQEAAPAGVETADIQARLKDQADSTCNQPRSTSSNEGRWVWAVSRAGGTLLSMCLVYDVISWVLCTIIPQWCDPATCKEPAFHSIHRAAGAAAGKGTIHVGMAEVAAYLQLCLRGFLPFLLLILGIDIGYCWIRLAVYAAAAIFPELRPFARQLPEHTLQRPWAAPNLRDYWGVRCQQLSRFHFEHLGYPVVDKLLPPTAPPALRARLHVAAAFLMTALTHTYMNVAAYGSYTNCYFAFFAVHYLALMMESWASTVIVPALQQAWQGRQGQSKGTAASGGAGAGDTVRHDRSRAGKASTDKHGFGVLGKLLGHVWVWCALVLASPLFFEPMRAGGFYSRAAYHLFGRPLVPMLLSWVAVQEHGQLLFASDWLEAAQPTQEK